MFCFDLPTTAKINYLNRLQKAGINIGALNIMTGVDWTYIRCSNSDLSGNETIFGSLDLNDVSLAFMLSNSTPCMLITPTREQAQMLIQSSARGGFELVRQPVDKLPEPFDYKTQIERYRVASLLDATE